MKYLARIGDEQREYTFERRGDLLIVTTAGELVGTVLIPNPVRRSVGRTVVTGFHHVPHGSSAADAPN